MLLDNRDVNRLIERNTFVQKDQKAKQVKKKYNRCEIIMPVLIVRTRQPVTEHIQMHIIEFSETYSDTFNKYHYDLYVLGFLHSRLICMHQKSINIM